MRRRYRTQADRSHSMGKPLREVSGSAGTEVTARRGSWPFRAYPHLLYWLSRWAGTATLARNRPAPRLEPAFSSEATHCSTVRSSYSCASLPSLQVATHFARYDDLCRLMQSSRHATHPSVRQQLSSLIPLFNVEFSSCLLVGRITFIPFTLFDPKTAPGISHQKEAPANQAATALNKPSAASVACITLPRL